MWDYHVQAALPWSSAGNTLVIPATSCLALAGTQQGHFLLWAGENHGTGTSAAGAQLSAAGWEGRP